MREYQNLVQICTNGQLAMGEMFDGHLRRIERDAGGLHPRTSA